LVDHEFNFTEGLQVVRGANEQGKSTILEAIAYALFGIKACRDSLDQVVTWGQPEKSLKVELTLEHDNGEYVITRSKSGAEITWKHLPTINAARKIDTQQGRVTGHGECTTFVELLLGVNATSVSRLMLASQGMIRGALDAGGKATMELIEQLADFDVIDQVLEVASAQLHTGHAAPLEEKVHSLTERAEALQGAVAEPVRAVFEAAKAQIQDRIVLQQKEVDETWKKAHDDAQAAVNTSQAAKQLRYSLSQNLERSKGALLVTLQQAAEARAIAERTVDSTQVAILESQIANAAQEEVRFSAHERVQKLHAAYPEVFWEGDAEEFNRVIAAVQERVSRAREVLAGTEAEIRVLTSSLVSGEGKCKACGQELPNAAAVAAHNKEISKKIEAWKAQKGLEEAILKAIQAEQRQLVAVQDCAKPYETAAHALSQYVDVDDNQVPCVLKWKGEIPKLRMTVGTLKKQLVDLRQAVKAQADAAARWEALSGTAAGQEEVIAGLEQQIVTCSGPADALAANKEQLEKVSSQYMLRVDGIGECRAQLAKIDQDYAVAVATYQGYLVRQGEAQAAVATAKAELDELIFNNALVKAIRAARPIIADKLWSVVLAAVSTYFSTMRGEKSVVTREGANFKVDGHVVGGGGLSGSALDLLGLAIRMALTRTFLPTAPFMILDEPAAAMDEGRTRQMLGFLVAAGFKQTILVTHESESESVANNLITI
jgi:exonuclease SbcC